MRNIWLLLLTLAILFSKVSNLLSQTTYLDGTRKSYFIKRKKKQEKRHVGTRILHAREYCPILKHV